MPLKLIEHNSVEYHQMVQLRMQLLRKPLGLSFTSEELASEAKDILIGYFDDDKLEGCCILTPETEDTIRLRQMAVLGSLQGKGIGKAILQFAENIARDKGFKKMIMHARNTAIGFYEKLGYQTIGEEFIEVTIPHYTMEKKL